MHYTKNTQTFVQYGLMAAMLMVVVLCISPPDILLLKRVANFTVQIMLAFFAAGMLFFLLGNKRLVLASFASCALLCLYLKSVSNQNLRLATSNSEPRISIANINLSLSDEYNSTLSTIINTDADLISFQEVTPDWHEILSELLSQKYPYQSSVVRIDPYGLAMYCKYPFSDVDTFYYDEIPNLRVTLTSEDDKKIHIVSSHTSVPATREAYTSIREHFEVISDYRAALKDPVITVGDYNLPSWSDEIKYFKFLTDLNDSRRDIVPVSMQGNFSLLKVPVDHIFYCDRIECTDFQVLTSKNANHLGILGSYQLIASALPNVAQME